MIVKQLSLSEVFNQSHLDKGLRSIAEKVQNNERLTEEEGILLFEKGELGFVGALANHIATNLHQRQGILQPQLSYRAYECVRVHLQLLFLLAPIQAPR
jgi:hypothetical protein